MNFQFDHHQGHIRSSWNPTRMLIRKKLTDRKIAKYQEAGWYSDEFRQERRELMKRKQSKREGSFLKVDGRLIYNPK